MQRHVFGVLAAMMAATALIAAQGTAQTTSPQTTTPKAGSDITVTGCLTQGSSPTVFLLDNAKKNPTDKAEKSQSWVVVSAAEDLPLAANLNHEVSITGSAEASAMTSPTAAGQKPAEKDLPRFSAKTVTLVADRCTAQTH